MAAGVSPTGAPAEVVTIQRPVGRATTGGAAVPAVPTDQALEQRLESLRAAVNQKLAFNADGSLSAGKAELKSLAQFLLDNPGRFGNLESSGVLARETLTRGLSGPSEAEGLAKRQKAIMAYLSSAQLRNQQSGGTPDPESPNGTTPPSEGRTTPGQEGTGSRETIVDTLRVNNVSSIGLFSKKENIEILHTQGATPSAPAVTVFINKTNPQTAYISISRVGADGKLTATEIASVASADVLGSAGSRPSKLTATIWTPGASGAKEKLGDMNLSGLAEADIAKIEQALRTKLKPKTTPSEAPGGGRGSATLEQPADGAGGAGQDSAVPETSTPPAGSPSGQPAPQPARLLPDGKLDKAEGMLLLKTPGVLNKLRSEFSTDAVVRSDKDKVKLVFANATVRLNWRDGEAAVDWRDDTSEAQRRAWVKQFEQRLKNVIDGTTEATSSTATRIIGNPDLVKDWLKRPGAFESLQGTFGARQVRKSGDEIIIDGIATFRTAEINVKTGKVILRQTGLINPDFRDSARTAEVTALVERRLREARDGFFSSSSLIGNSATFDATDKRTIAAWLQKPGLTGFLKERFGHSDVQENAKTIQFKESGLTITLQKGSGAVMIQRHEGLFGGSVRTVTANPAEVKRVKDWLRDAMVAFDARQ